MSERVLVTGGAGFIGSHLCDALLARGDHVRVLDSLIEQVHGARVMRPAYLAEDVELVVGDVRDPVAVEGALQGVDAVVHLAARVGVGQSMYELAEYVDVNCRGTAVLLDRLAANPVRRLVVASSMSVYGEGAYVDVRNRSVEPPLRSWAQLEHGEWEPAWPDTIWPVPTPETKPLRLASVYALTKFDQEQLCLIYGEAFGVPTLALRLFNTYGPRQALSNPYTGVLAIFASALLNGRRPLVFEDGRQMRDFVDVRDVAAAFVRALTLDAKGEAVNVGTGEPVTVLAIAHQLAALLGLELEPELSGKARAGDVRHCFADVEQARHLLGFKAEVGLEDGLPTLVSWLACQTDVRDGSGAALAELLDRRLAR